MYEQTVTFTLYFNCDRDFNKHILCFNKHYFLEAHLSDWHNTNDW